MLKLSGVSKIHQAGEVQTTALDRIDRIEAALTRMSRLVERLLQLARADAGLGAGPRPHDLRARFIPACAGNSPRRRRCTEVAPEKWSS